MDFRNEQDVDDYIVETIKKPYSVALAAWHVDRGVIVNRLNLSAQTQPRLGGLAAAPA